MRVAIIGAGIAGLACADALRAQGVSPVIFEKSRGTGGRLATRRSEAGSFDHGAQFITARDDGFQAYLARAAEAGFAAQWTPAMDPAPSADWWTGRPGMSGVVKPLAEGLDIRTGQRVERLTRHDQDWVITLADGPEARFDSVLLAIPVEQARILLGDHLTAFPELAGVRLAPCWTVMLGFETATGLPLDVVRTDGALAWAAREQGRPGREGAMERWVVQASADWSRAHLEDAPETVIAAMTRALEALSPAALPEAAHAAAHRWRYAKVETALEADCVWKPELALGLAGDWCLGPRVEAAWLSGRALAKRIQPALAAT